jgi:hypothetical protein
VSDALRPDRARVTAWAAFLDGWRRTLGAPMLTAGLLAAAVLTSLPVLTAAGGSLGPDPLQILLRTPVSLPGIGLGWADWMGVSGPGARDDWQQPAGIAALSAYLLVWTFLTGGVIDRLARGRAVDATAFFAACGMHVLRFIRLAGLVGAAGWAIWIWLHPLMPDVVFVALLAVIYVIADITRVRLVVEDRRSAVAATLAAVRFIRRRPVRVTVLYLLHTVVLVVAMWFWPLGMLPPGSPGWLALLAAGLSLLVPLWIRLAVIASEIALFQGDLAHAGYTASRWPVWPDSPSVEAMDNFLDRARAESLPLRDA